MSKYKVIQTEFRSLDSLISALTDVLGSCQDFEVARDPKTPSLPLYGYLNDRRTECASVRIPRGIVNRYSGGMSNDIGFTWNGRCYQAVVSEYDGTRTGNQTMLSQVKQRYALHEVRSQAKAKGYTTRETAQPDGTIRITLTHR